MRTGPFAKALVLAALAIALPSTVVAVDPDAETISLLESQETRVAEAVDLSEGFHARTQFADALLNGAGGATNVRLFNAVFTEKRRGLVRAAGPQLGMSLSGGATPPAPSTKTAQAKQHAANNEKLSAKLAKLKMAEKQVEATKAKENKMKKKVKQTGQKTLVSEFFENTSPNGWQATTADMRKLPGSSLRMVSS
jgi:hypothetical protein